MDQIPLVDYLVLSPRPHLVAHECTTCAARYFDRRNACARCGRQGFGSVAVATTGSLVTYTVVHLAAEGVPVPFVAGVVDCGGTAVRTNVVNVAPDRVTGGMRLRLTTVPGGVDADGIEAVGYGFEPVD